MSTTDGETYERIEDRKHSNQLEQQGHSANLLEREFENAKAELIEKLMESNLTTGTINALDNLLSPDFILGRMEKKDIIQFQWQLETAMIQLFAMHPPQGGVAGVARMYYYDDPDDALVPLRPQDRAELRSFKKGIMQRVSRSYKGFQQDKLGETTSRVETINRKEEEESKGRIRGFLGR